MGGVVTNTAGLSLYEEVSNRLGISAADFYKICKKGTEQDLFNALEKGVIEPKDFWKEISVALGKSIHTDWFRILFHPVLNKKTVEVINELKKIDGARIVCGTNTIQSHYDNHLSRGDYSFFDMTYASHQMGVAKPDVKFFSMILQAERICAEQTFFIDDKAENCNAAASLGITCCKFESAEKLLKMAMNFVKTQTGFISK